MLNLTKDISVEAVEVDRSIFKIVSMSVIGAAAFAIFGYFLKLFVITGGINYLVFSSVALIFFLSVFFLQAFFIKSALMANLAILFECLVLASIFYDRIGSEAFLISAGLAFLFLVWANYSGGKELRNMIKINFWRVSKMVLPKAFAAAALFASVALIGLPNSEFFISKENFQKIFVPSATMAKRFFPDFDPALSINEIAVRMAERELEQTSQSQFLPKSTKTQLINQSVNEFENKISGWAGSSINTKANLTEAIYELIKNEYLSLPEKDRQLVLVGAIIFIFLMIEGFSLPIRIAVTFLAYIIYEILIAFGVVAVMLEGKSREIVVLK